MTSRPALLQRIAGTLCVVGILAMPLDWVPLLVAGGVVLEIPNVASAGFTLLLPFAILMSWRTRWIHLVFGLLVLWSLLYWVAMILNRTPEGIPILRQQFMQAAFGWTLAICIAQSTIRISRIAILGLISLAAMLHLSAVLAGINLFTAIADYLLTGNRTNFVYRGLSPIFNAFVSNTSDIGYLASQMNSLSGSIVVLVILSFVKDEDGKTGIMRLRNGFALAFLPFVFIIFSASANLVVLTLLAVLAFEALTRSHAFIRLALPMAFVVTAVLIYGPVNEFVSANLMEDTASRGARLGQYERAAEVISDNILLGAGYFEYGGHPVHNWPLFSWSAAGYLPFLVTLLFYVLTAVAGARSLKYLRHHEIVVFPLLMMILVRTSFGGAGGIPIGSSIIALAVLLGLLERQRRTSGQRSLAAGSVAAPLSHRYAAVR